VLALTSDNEGTPVSIIEAMAASVPVLATDAGGVRDLVGTPDDSLKPGEHDVCDRGVLCCKNDVDGFVKGLSFLIGEKPQEKKDRCDRARAFVEALFSRERLLADMERLYGELAGCGRGYVISRKQPLQFQEQFQIPLDFPSPGAGKGRGAEAGLEGL
jgi:glycosyltransferase involved in cell wall biosynthesis